MKSYYLFVIAFIISSKLFADDLTATVSNAVTGLNNGAIALDISGGYAPYSYSWTGPGGFTATTEDISALAPGEYCVTVTDAYCGTATLCATVEEVSANSIADITLQSVNMYPNPFQSSICLEFNVVEAGKFIIAISNITGQEIASNQYTFAAGEQKLTFQVPNTFPFGNYNISIVNSRGQKISQELVHKQ